MDSNTLLMLCLVCFAGVGTAKKTRPGQYIQLIDDVKVFKKLLRVRTNVLAVFAASEKTMSSSMPTYDQVADEMKGRAAIVWINCGESKKMCKKLKVSPSTVILKHYKDGEFNKDYDRKDAVRSMVRFLEDPTGDAPWEEEEAAADIVHIETIQMFAKLFDKEGKKLPIFIMFYAPWCGFCKKMKPDFAAAATAIKGHTILVGINSDKPEMSAAKQHYNISGYPTLLYFRKGSQGEITYQYNGEQKKDDIISWLKDPKPSERPKEEGAWADEEDSDVVHLTDEESFDRVIADNPSVLVMFYAPWCGHCKKMKPEYTKAAARMKEEGLTGVLAALDATQARSVAERFKVKGYPTVKYFKDGNESFAFTGRDEEKIIEFMKDPQEPPPPPPPEPKWAEVEGDVVHLTSENYRGFLKKRKHALVMLYAPWCGFCKKAKPEYMDAATQLKDNTKVALTAIDCTEEQAVCSSLDVTGYPTFLYFVYGKNPQPYSRGTKAADFVAFLSDPLSPAAAAAAPAGAGSDWAETAGGADVHQLTATTFDAFLVEHPSALVMFYAPWCGHCKKMKPDFAAAAARLKNENFEGVLAAIDGSSDDGRPLMSRFEVKGFPTLKYFKDGKMEMTYKGKRTTDGLVAFMYNPAPAAPPPPPPAQPPTPPSEQAPPPPPPPPAGVKPPSPPAAQPPSPPADQPLKEPASKTPEQPPSAPPPARPPAATQPPKEPAGKTPEQPPSAPPPAQPPAATQPPAPKVEL